MLLFRSLLLLLQLLRRTKSSLSSEPASAPLKATMLAPLLWLLSLATVTTFFLWRRLRPLRLAAALVQPVPEVVGRQRAVVALAGADAQLVADGVLQLPRPVLVVVVAVVAVVVRVSAVLSICAPALPATAASVASATSAAAALPATATPSTLAMIILPLVIVLHRHRLEATERILECEANIRDIHLRKRLPI